jgi:hypothetical protein
LHVLIIASLLLAMISAAMLYPSLSDFGHRLIGVEDIKFFLWLFWHYEDSIHNGANPIFAGEIFYPDGIWLSRSTFTPMAAALYLIMPQAWGPFGRITIIQLTSLVLGGIFSFAFCYRLMKAESAGMEKDSGSMNNALPAMLGAIVFVFSTFYLLTIAHYMNYAVAMPFLPLFFIFYLDQKTGDSKAIAPLAASLLLIALGEPTIVLMLGLIISIDIASAYMKHGGRRIGPREVIVLALSGVLSLVLSTLLALDQRLIISAYLLPPAFFISCALFLVIGARTAWRAEMEMGRTRALLIASIPACAYIVAIGLLPAYQMQQDPIFLDSFLTKVQLQHLFLPSDMSALGNLLRTSQPITEGSGTYMGWVTLAMLAVSFLFKGAGTEEVRFRDLMLVSLLLAFPIVVLENQFLAGSPFFPQTIFPMLSVLRAPSRFILFTMLFAGGCVCLTARRILDSRWRLAYAAISIIAILTLVDAWPDYGAMMFTPSVPSFYDSLSGNHPPIFLYPDLGYYEALDEVYYQTVHQSPISYGVVSRDPSPDNPLKSIYWGNTTEAQMLGFVKENGFGYVVVRKTRCKGASDCFFGRQTPIANLSDIESDLGRAFGKPVFEDDAMLAYDAGGNGFRNR